MYNPSPNYHSQTNKEFLEFEPYRQGYTAWGQKNNKNVNPWNLGSLGYYLFEQGSKDARENQKENHDQIL